MEKRILSLLQIINVRWYNASADYAINISCHLAKRGHRVLVAGRTDSPAIERAKAIGLETDVTMRFTPLSFPADLYKLAAIVKKRKIDIINAHRAEGHALAVALQRINRDYRIIRTRVDIRSPRRNYFNSYIHRHTDMIIVPAEFLKKEIINSTGVKDSAIQVVYGGVDTEIFGRDGNAGEFRKSLGISLNDRVIGMVARLDPIKGHFVFLQVAKRLRSMFPDLKFVVVGREEEYSISYLKQYALNQGLDKNVFFTGYIEDVNSAISSFDICVLTSLGSEAHSRVIFEYMLCGKPVVTSSVGIIPEIIDDGQDGILVLPGDVDAFVKNIATLIEDHDLSTRLGQNARKKVLEKYTMNAFIDTVEGLYREVCKGREEI